MTTKELIHAEIESVPEEKLDDLYRLIKRFVTPKESLRHGSGILSKLRSVRINAPADFAENLDLYLSGEKRVEDDIHSS